MAAEQTDPDFVQFASMMWGIRAAYCIFETYARHYGAKTPAEIINRWAPPSENNTKNYIRLACQWSALEPDQELIPVQWPRLARAMVRLETGRDLGVNIFFDALDLYNKTKN